MDFNFLYLRSRIRQIPRCAHAKALQYILGLLIDLTGTPRHVGFGFICPVLDIRIGDCGTNGVRIRIFVSYNVYFPLFRHILFLSGFPA